MAKLTSSQYAQKWAERLGNATTDIERGVNAVTESPMEKAVLKQAKMLQNFTKSINDGTWATKTKAVSLSTWKQKTLSKGIPRIAGGAQDAIPKMQAFADRLLPYQETLKGQIAGMNDLTLQDNIQRMVAWVNGMAKMPK